MVQAVRMKNYIIAGNFDEYLQWVSKSNLSPNSAICVSSPAVLRGTQNPHGFFIGTWRERDDLEDIFMELLTRTDITSDSHRTITKIWGKWKDD